MQELLYSARSEMENSKKPYFSILIPTYNRASFLPLAITSVLEQTFADFELIISNGGSTDNTKEAVGTFNDKRIKYVESQTRLSMGENYQRAFDSATGEFIIFFSDDDAFVPTMLERVERVIRDKRAKMVVFHTAYYYHEKFEEFNKLISTNSLLFFSSTGEVSPVRSQDALPQMFVDLGILAAPKDTNHFQPYIGNIVCHYSIYNKIKQIRPQLFPVIPVDVYLVAMILGLADEYYHLNEPLIVWSRWSKNATASLNMKGNSLRQHYENLLEGRTLNHVPVKFPLPLNLCVNALLQARQDLPDRMKENLEIDWVGYFVNVYNNLVYLKSLDIETSEEVCEFYERLSEQPLDFQKTVHRKLSEMKFVLKHFIRQNLPFVEKAVKRILKDPTSSRLTIIKGNDAGFADFLEAARFLDKRVLPKASD